MVGKKLPAADGYIAAMAFAKGYAVASRDEGPFLAAGLEVINPWD
ncbi:Probable ribonuclease FitB [Mycobacteroides abscessus subsp. abscessus]|nr:Probable ribonuclease FitB [Mycobacteroides abscessus subsp. abscessus]